jgi:outer membrane protein
MDVRARRAGLRAVVIGMCVGAAALPLVGSHAYAEDNGKAADSSKAAMVPAILIVDLQQVLHDSKAGKGVQAALNEESQAYSKEVARQEDDLQKMRSDLERQRTALSAEAFNAKAKAFQQRYQEFDRGVQAKRQALQGALNDAIHKVEKAALDIITQMAKERGANLVLAKQAVILQSENADAEITTEVVARLDKTLESVAVDFPKDNQVSSKKTREEAPKKN